MLFDFSSLFGSATSFLGEVNPAELMENIDPEAVLSEAVLDASALTNGSAMETLTSLFEQNRP